MMRENLPMALYRPVFLGTATKRWAFYRSVSQSFVHVYYDGFRWKMRERRLRQNL